MGAPPITTIVSGWPTHTQWAGPGGGGPGAGWGRASAREVGEGLLRFGQPCPPGRQGRRRAVAGRLVTLLVCAVELTLKVLDRLADLVDRVPGPGQRLGIGPAPLDVLGPADGVVHLLHAALQPLLSLPGNGPDLVPALVDRTERGARGLRVSHRKRLLCLGEQLALSRGSLA